MPGMHGANAMLLFRRDPPWDTMSHFLRFPFPVQFSSGPRWGKFIFILCPVRRAVQRRFPVLRIWQYERQHPTRCRSGAMVAGSSLAPPSNEVKHSPFRCNGERSTGTDPAVFPMGLRRRSGRNKDDDDGDDDDDDGLVAGR